MILALVAAALAWGELGPEAAPTGRTIDPWAVLSRAPPPWHDKPLLAEPEVREVAASAAAWLRAWPEDPASAPGLLGELGYTREALIDGLDRVAAACDATLRDPAFYDAWFDWLAWTPDATAAAAHGVAVDRGLRLTRYVVYEVRGAAERTATFNTALYAVPDDDAGPDPSRLRYTRQQVIGGVYEAGGAAAGLARPLVWLTRDGVYQAILQGTVSVTTADGRHLYNVHKSNGIPYDRAIRDPAAQPRYWYFREVPRLLGYTSGDRPAVAIAPRVTVAGDVYNLGLGRLVLLDTGPELRLVVLADTGGAFQPNLYQLDWMAGVYPDRAALDAATAHVPERVAAGVLVPRRAP